MQDQTAAPNLTIEPGVADQTTTAEKPVAQQLNSFQLKQHNENVIARLMQTGLFASKQHLLQAALMSLFGTLQQAMKRAEAPKKPTTEETAEKFLAENHPLMEDLAAAEEAEKGAGTVPEFDNQDEYDAPDIWNATEKHHVFKDGVAHEVIGEPNTNLQD